MGLAFLSDIQVFLFLEAAQGDTRTNVMQAPKLTLFNGQTATLNVGDTQFFGGGGDVLGFSQDDEPAEFVEEHKTTVPRGPSGPRGTGSGRYRTSNRSASITLVHAATKSFTNFSFESAQP